MCAISRLSNLQQNETISSNGAIAENGKKSLVLNRKALKSISAMSTKAQTELSTMIAVNDFHRECCSRKVNEGEFDPVKHFYPRAVNAEIHSLIETFLSMGNDRIVARYTNLNPRVKPEVLKNILSYIPSHFQWAGSDLFNVTTASGQRQMIVIETNSCPSGQKSMPFLSKTCEGNAQRGYRRVIEAAFENQLSKADPSMGGLAVICDKNMMECSGYAAVLADVAKEKVWICEWFMNETDPDAKWIDGVLYIRDSHKVWHPIRACFRYLTQKPWNRFPIKTKTVVVNEIISCIAGGRNKIMAAIAYDQYNCELAGTGLSIRTPQTISNVNRCKIPFYIKSMGGRGVLKIPYSNAGQGVYTITNKIELKDFMSQSYHYDKFLVQSLVGKAGWSSKKRSNNYFHVGTIPNKNNNIYVTDIRLMITGSKQGFCPVCIFARKAKTPLSTELSADVNSWEMLGTNLSLQSHNGTWSTDTTRLILMDQHDFSQLGLSIDDLIDAYIQTVLAVTGIDRMAKKLLANGEFDYKLFKRLNPDNALIDEIRQANGDEILPPPKSISLMERFGPKQNR
ncbi:hypothetical protein HA402_014892 [Bradysia odoriphaga]|nr:hypothetical protein HA402_014892 [Bradysia odoriphaga]